MGRYTLTLDWRPLPPATSETLDAIAEPLYAGGELEHLALSLDDDGTLSFLFEIEADDYPHAVERAIDVLRAAHSGFVANRLEVAAA